MDSTRTSRRRTALDTKETSNLAARRTFASNQFQNPSSVLAAFWQAFGGELLRPPTSLESELPLLIDFGRRHVRRLGPVALWCSELGLLSA
jgi:hypothetical protein